MTEWKCPKCGWTYRSPIPVKGVRHACHPTSTTRSTLRPITHTTTKEGTQQ